MAVASAVAAVLGFADQLADPARLRPDAADGHARRRLDPLRAREPARLADRRRRRPAGRRDGPAAAPFGRFEFDLARPRRRSPTSLFVLVVCLLLVRRLVHSPFGFSLQALRDNRLRAAASALPVNARLVAVYTPRRGARRRGRRAARADHRLRLARRARLPPQRRGAAGARDRRHRLPLGRPVRRDRVQAAARPPLGLDAAVLDLLARRCSWSCWCWSAAIGWSRPWTWWRSDERGDRSSSRPAGLVEALRRHHGDRRRLAPGRARARATR